MMRRIFISIIILLVSVSVPLNAVQAQTPDYSFVHFNSSNSNLSFNKTHVITQDANGFIWIGSADGLNRYDGNDFRTFGKEDLGVSSAFVTSLCPDDEGNLYIGTDSGISYYDYRQDSFIPINMKSLQGTVPTNRVSKMFMDKNGNAWFAVLHQGLFSYDGKELVNYFYEEGKVTIPSSIRAFFIDSNGVFWFSLYYDDLYWSDDNLKTIHKAEVGPDGDYFKGDDVMGICRNPLSNQLFVASNNRGLCSVDPRSRNVKVLIPNDDGFVIESMTADDYNHIWLSTTKGVYRYDITTGETAVLRQDSSNPYGLADNHVFDAYVDNTGGLYLATYSKGVAYSDKGQSLFEKAYMTEDGYSLKGSLVRSMCTDDDGNVWIATENSGLFIYSVRRGVLNRYTKSQLPDNLFGLCYDDGKLWVGSFEGMYCLDIRKSEVKLYSRVEESSSFMDSKIYTICRTSTSEIYFGTTLGLFRYDKNDDSFKSVEAFDGIFVTDVAEDHKGRLWISSYADGIFCMDMSDGNVVNYSRNAAGDFNLSCNKIDAVHEDASGRIWAASFGFGFYLLDETEGPAFREFNSGNTEGLHCNVFYKLVDDSEGNIWLSSSRGLVAFNTEEGVIRTFTEADGLLDNDFNYQSMLKLPDGRLAFGSTNGFVVFSPSDVLSAATEGTELFFTDFTVNGNIVKPAEKDSYLSMNINVTDRITLSPGDNTFGVGISVPAMKASVVYCMLDGYDKGWRKAGPDNRFTWDNVPPGRYTIQSKTQYGEFHAPIRVKVRQKFLKSTPAIAMYILLAMMAVYLVIRYLYTKADRKAERERIEYEKLREEELYNEKLSFFMNVIHEIKTPLTLIKTPLQNIIATEAVSESGREDMEVISHSADYLGQLVKELLDFIRFEKHGYVLECMKVDLISKIDFLIRNFEDTAKSKNIDLRFIHEGGDVHINADDSGLNKILNNLLHNAVKYADTFIELEVSSNGDNAVVRLTNDGPIIPESRRKDIFKPFTKYASNPDTDAQSFGIGLSFARNLTELHGGTLVLDETAEYTSFVLTLPIRKEESALESKSPEILGTGDNLPLLLIVEDNADLLSYMQSKFSDEYRILPCKTAEKALAALRRYNVNIIITDISLPGMNGVEFCAKVKSEFEWSHIPVIVLSAISNSKTKSACMENGASQYIEKPFDLDYLKACLKSEVSRRMSVHKGGADTSDEDIDVFVPGSDKKFLESLDKIIRENITDPELSNEQLAAALFISKTTLLRKVKGLLGMTPNDYVRLQRLNLAAQMLSKDNCRISEVCYAVGFNTPSYFAKCFKIQFGVLPAEYMKQNNKIINNQQN